MSKNIYNMSLEELNAEIETTVELSKNTPDNVMIELYGTYTNMPQKVAKLIIVHHLSNLIKEISVKKNEIPKSESIAQENYQLEKIATNEIKKVVEIAEENADATADPKEAKVDLLDISKIFNKKNPKVKKLHKRTIASLNDRNNRRAFVFAKELRAFRMPYEEVAIELNRNGYKTSIGNPYTMHSVSHLLTYFDKHIKMLS